MKMHPHRLALTKVRDRNLNIDGIDFEKMLKKTKKKTKTRITTKRANGAGRNKANWQAIVNEI